MSVALEFAPDVRVPERARRDAPDATVLPLYRPADPTNAPPLRLTARGVVVVAVLVALLGGVLVWLASASAPAATPRPAGVPATVTVRSGDTLWSIAGRVAPGRDPRAEVDRLQRLNHLSGSALIPGQQLRTR